MARCWHCNIPQPKAWNQSLHIADCPEHDEDTCLACQDEEVAKAINDLEEQE